MSRFDQTKMLGKPQVDRQHYQDLIPEVLLYDIVYKGDEERLKEIDWLLAGDCDVAYHFNREYGQYICVYCKVE